MQIIQWGKKRNPKNILCNETPKLHIKKEQIINAKHIQRTPQSDKKSKSGKCESKYYELINDRKKKIA